MLIKEITKWSILMGFLVIVTIASTELLLTFFYKNPSLSPLPIDYMRTVYLREYRNVIQSTPDCVIYDDMLTYRLKPGGCQFDNLEFSTFVSANSAGLRDDEAALSGPEVIFLGDSVTMGWGVEDDETFPHLFEQLTGLNTLNAGISSYGTPREMRMLSQIDTRQVKAVVVQYSSNDLRETKEFADKGELKPLSKNEYWKVMESYQQGLSYYPGKHTLLALYYLWRGLGATAEIPAEATGMQQETQYLLTSLRAIPMDTGKTAVYVFEMNECHLQRPDFAAVLTAILDNEPPQSPVHGLQVLDFNPVITADMCFEIDGHINQDGHRKIAEELVRSIRIESE